MFTSDSVNIYSGVVNILTSDLTNVFIAVLAFIMYISVLASIFCSSLAIVHTTGLTNMLTSS